MRGFLIRVGFYGCRLRQWGRWGGGADSSRDGAALAVILAAAPMSGAQSVELRIVGGSTASISTYPWQGALVYSSAQYPGLDAHIRQFCGGSLVTASIVVTAAHCVYNTDPDCSGGGSSCHPSDPVEMAQRRSIRTTSTSSWEDDALE
jgi:hypothetical protein